MADFVSDTNTAMKGWPSQEIAQMVWLYSGSYSSLFLTNLEKLEWGPCGVSRLVESRDSTNVRASHWSLWHDSKVHSFRIFRKARRTQVLRQAAMMFTLGAMISGLSMAGLVKLGPLEENWATAYALVFPITVPPNSILSMGVLEDSMQFFNWIDSAKPIKLTVVNRHLSPLKGVMIKAIVPFLMLDAQESLKTM